MKHPSNQEMCGNKNIWCKIMDQMSPLYATISWAYSVFFYTCIKLYSKQIETLELAPKFVKQLFVNNKAYDPAYHAYCLRMLALPVFTLHKFFFKDRLEELKVRIFTFIQWSGLFICHYLSIDYVESLFY